MDNLPPRVRSIRPIALCLRGQAVCPVCGRLFLNATMTADGSALLRCTRKNNISRRPCHGRAYVIGGGFTYCTVVSISPAEWDQLEKRDSVEVLRDIGALIEAIRSVNDNERLDVAS